MKRSRKTLSSRKRGFSATIATQAASCIGEVAADAGCIGITTTITPTITATTITATIIIATIGIIDIITGGGGEPLKGRRGSPVENANQSDFQESLAAALSPERQKRRGVPDWPSPLLRQAA